MRIIVLLLISVLSACMGLKVEVDEQLTFDPLGYKTYAWTNKPMVDTTGRQEVILRGDGILRAQVDALLQERGYQQVNREDADFLVDYRFSQTMKADQGGIISPTDELAGAWDLGDDVNNTQLHNHNVNAYILHSNLKLIMTDSEGQTLWRARATKLVDNESPSDEELGKTLSKILGKMLSDFPKQD